MQSQQLRCPECNAENFGLHTTMQTLSPILASYAAGSCPSDMRRSLCRHHCIDYIIHADVRQGYRRRRPRV